MKPVTYCFNVQLNVFSTRGQINNESITPCCTWRMVMTSKIQSRVPLYMVGIQYAQLCSTEPDLAIVYTLIVQSHILVKGRQTCANDTNFMREG